jgi:hypothetical protein
MIVVLNTADHCAQELLRNIKIVDRPASDRAVNFRIVRLTPQKLQRLRSD